jgi:hypothetical protein
MRLICGSVIIGSKMKEMKVHDFSNLIFPSFPENKQQEIAKKYYNLVPKNTPSAFQPATTREGHLEINLEN